MWYRHLIFVVVDVLWSIDLAYVCVGLWFTELINSTELFTLIAAIFAMPTASML